MTPLEAAIQAINERTAGVTDEAQLLVAAKCRALVTAYDRKWGGIPWKTIAVETFQSVPLFNIDTERQSRSFQMAGKIDVIAEYGERRYIIDHKTTSVDISDPAAPFWRQLVIDGQVSHYMLMEWIRGHKLDGAVWDVLRKPAIRPKKLTKAETKEMIQHGTYCGVKVPKQYRLLETENLELYEVRLTQDATERPEWYFQRKMIPRLDSELADYCRDAWDNGKEILHSRQTGRATRNSGACLMYGSPCKFLGICSGHDSIDSDRWNKRTQVHPELDGYVDGDTRDLLTTSRIRCFQTCRQKHHLQYEVGLERIDEEEREAIYFGNVWHSAQEKWWSLQGVDAEPVCLKG